MSFFYILLILLMLHNNADQNESPTQLAILEDI